MSMFNRRMFLKTCAASATALTCPTGQAYSSSSDIPSADRLGVLVDTTACLGCRKCEWACSKAHDLPTESFERTSVSLSSDTRRRTSTDQLTVVNTYALPESPASTVSVKTQCMHCDHPSCVSACIVGAFTKHENGAVTWDTEKCIGCRYCMIACPFQIPAFEFSKALQPKIEKCDFCYERISRGEVPACVAICPAEALTFGPRMELINIARKRINQNPDRYINHVFGELEGGGTSWLYLAGVDFRELMFPTLGNDPMPGTTESIQHGIFAYFVPPVALYALLGGLMWISKKRKDVEQAEYHE